MHRWLSIGLLIKRDIDGFRYIVGRGDFVVSRTRGDDTATVVPQQLFRRQPTHALHKAPFYLAFIDRGIQ